MSESQTECKCNHLTHFAVLMDITESIDESNAGDTKVYVSFSVLSMVYDCISWQHVSFQVHIPIKQGTYGENAFVV